jgi:N6-L-threonylcarbamoyladenine synthase
MLLKIVLSNFTNKLKSISISRVMSSTSLRYVLGIETSCDETGVSIVSQNGDIQSDVCRSQLAIHLSNGGIIPPVARHLHKQCIDDCVRESLRLAQLSPQQLTAIAVTLKPGLPLSLVIGKNYAKSLALKYKKPLIPIHHMEAHALIALMNNNRLNFPFVTLLISGGHCLLGLVKDVNRFELFGESIDDAPGDLFDKIARKLRLKNLGSPYNQMSGGAALELCARSGDPFTYFQKFVSYPLYTQSVRSCHFSFSGFYPMINRVIDTLERELNTEPDRVLTQAPDICASLQFAVTFMFIKRLQRAFNYINDYNIINGQPIKLVISGGCASNQFITESIRNFCKSQDVEVFVPPKKFCTDNGVMIAWNGILKLLNEHKFPQMILRDQQSIKSVDILAKAPFGEDVSHEIIKKHVKCESINVKEFIPIYKDSDSMSITN